MRSTFSPVNTSQLRIAVVDDDRFLLRLLGAWVAFTAFEPLLLSSGQELLQSNLEDVVLVCLDLNLGDLSGLDVLRHLKARFPQVPVIVVTADSQLSTVVEAMRMGAVDYLMKPLEMQRFIQAIRGSLERRSAHDQSFQAGPPVAASRVQEANVNSPRAWPNSGPNRTSGAIPPARGSSSESFVWMEIEISRVGDEVRVSARGSRSEQIPPFTLPISYDTVKQFEYEVRAAARHGKPMTPESLETAQRLSRSILNSQIEALRVRLSEAADGRLLVRLAVLNPELQSIPWEAICKFDQVLGFWASSPDILPVRSVMSSAPWAPSAVEGALGVLAIAPSGNSTLYSLETALSQRILAGEIQWFAPLVGSSANASNIFDRLRRKPVPHVVHFVGHGAQEKGNPVLRLADNEDGEEVWLPVELLAQQLEANLRGYLRLIVLEACEGANPGVLASAAEILARAGADAVVAHLWPVRADVARVFSAQLYRALAGADRELADIAIAMNEARRAILGTFDATAQAFSPVVYLRGPNGIIFNFRERKATSHEEMPAKMFAPHEPVRQPYAHYAVSPPMNPPMNPAQKYPPPEPAPQQYPPQAFAPPNYPPAEPAPQIYVRQAEPQPPVAPTAPTTPKSTPRKPYASDTTKFTPVNGTPWAIVKRKGGT
jgi:DNA-binding response OmpR family regulator